MYSNTEFSDFICNKLVSVEYPHESADDKSAKLTHVVLRVNVTHCMPKKLLGGSILVLKYLPL
jgi:hypothetical protein